MAYSHSFIFGADSLDGRKARRTDAGCEYGHKGFVVVIETAHRSYQELDADSAEHGSALALAWVQHHGAISASVWSVSETGALRKRQGPIYSEMYGAE